MDRRRAVVIRPDWHFYFQQHFYVEVRKTDVPEPSLRSFGRFIRRFIGRSLLELQI